jgi:hypothetical protein
VRQHVSPKCFHCRYVMKPFYCIHNTSLISLLCFDVESVAVTSNYFYGWCRYWILYVVCVGYYGSSCVWLRCCTCAMCIALWLWLYCTQYGSSCVWLRCCTGAVCVALWLWLYCAQYGSSYVWLRCCTGAVCVVVWLLVYCYNGWCKYYTQTRRTNKSFNFNFN